MFSRYKFRKDSLNKLNYGRASQVLTLGIVLLSRRGPDEPINLVFLVP